MASMTSTWKKSMLRSREQWLLSLLHLCCLVGCIQAATVRRNDAVEQPGPSFSNKMSTSTKQAVRLYAAYTHQVSPHVDWDMLQDEYAISYIQSEKLNKRRLHRQRYRPSQRYHAKTLISSAVDAAQRAGSFTITDDAENTDMSSSDSDSPELAISVLDQALDDMDEIVAQAEAAQRSKAERQTVDDDVLGIDDDIIDDSPSRAPTGLAKVSVAPSAATDTAPPSVSPSESTDIAPPSAAPSESTNTDPPSAAPSESTDADPTPIRPDDDRVIPPDDDEFIGIPIPVYRYNPGTNCRTPGDGVPCAPDNLRELCDKGAGKFSDCLEACIPSFCCIHDAPQATNTIAPKCNEDPNCAEYAYCYIVWWKLHDTIGPATNLRVEQTDDFYDIDADFIEGDVTGSAFYQELLLHHFDDSQEVIDAGTVAINSTLAIFDSDLIFLNLDFWDAESAIPDPPP